MSASLLVTPAAFLACRPQDDARPARMVKADDVGIQAEPEPAEAESPLRSCQTCHGLDLAGGPVPGGDSAWPPAANLTPHESGLRDWTFDDLVRFSKIGARPDDSHVDGAMPWPALGRASQEELLELWEALRALQPVPSRT